VDSTWSQRLQQGKYGVDQSTNPTTGLPVPPFHEPLAHQVAPAKGRAPEGEKLIADAKVDLNVMPDGTLIARKVELEAEQNDEEVEGTVVSVNAASNQFQFVALDDEPNVANAALGAAITVQVEQGATFEVDTDGLTVPNGLSFASIQDVIVGQEIQIRPKSVAAGTPVTIMTDRVRLRTSQIMGTVASVSAPNFTINNLSGLFTMAGITQIQVDTSSGTNFDGVNGVASLTAGKIVSDRGLLFGRAGSPVLFAKKVRERGSD
jgi:hypothetical protein